MNVWQNLGRMRSGSIPTLADQAAFALLVQRNQRRVFNFLLSILHDNAEANDVTQEVFVAAWQGLPSFHGETRFSTWLSRITYTCSVRQLKRRQCEQARHSPILAEPFLEDRDNEKWAEETEERDDVQALVCEHVKRLPHIDRIVLLLRHQEHQTYEEMAEILTLPPGTDQDASLSSQEASHGTVAGSARRKRTSKLRMSARTFSQPQRKVRTPLRGKASLVRQGSG